MERIKALIDKLYQQEKQGCNPAQLLFTVQLLHSELIKFQQAQYSNSRSKVAVTLPLNYHITDEVLSIPDIETEIKPEPIAPVQKLTSAIRSAVPPSAEQKESKPSWTPEKEAFKKEDLPYIPQQQVMNPALESTVESPTLSQHNVAKEIHEVISQPKESLNDRLKQEKTEVAHTLKDTPIKDLRKGVGINDRFTFVNELFRGDEAMYERSIKTINGFSIYSEAEYWITRELKSKLGWDDNKEAVKHFCQLVRRRFA
jgi:hypothetical protein